jgi:pimeloyl-ACP methyl ester carboxylesterase
MASAIVVNGAAVTKPWMVMVHGMSQDHRVFSSQVEAFKPSYRILLVDLPGHGLSSALGGPFGHIEMASHVEHALAANEASNVYYWGTHTGATVGLYLAATSPSLIAALLLEGPLVPGANAPVVLGTIDRARATARTEGLAAAIDQWWRDSCWFEYMRTHPQTCRAAEHFAIIKEFTGRPWLDDLPSKPIANVDELISSISIPTLIYNGVTDHADFLEAAGHIRDLIGDAQTIAVPDAGGFPAWENPGAVNRLITEFLSQSDMTPIDNNGSHPQAAMRRELMP